MSKIVILPLDERPCNYLYPQYLPTNGIEVTLPPIEILGSKKTAGNYEKIKSWLIKETIDADFLVISLDTLLFGGIVPSRVNNLSADEIRSRISVISTIKENNPKIKILANELIMRCPSYSLSDEEPDYFDICGKEIFRYGQLLDIRAQGLSNDALESEFKALKQNITPEYLNDYINRRNINIEILLENLELVQKNIIDFFIIPQDDSNEFGFSSVDQNKVRTFINTKHLEQNIIMYPGADEVGLTLLARAVNEIHNCKPKVLVYYSSSKGKFVIPSFEDRIIDETIKYHIYAIGGIRVECLNDCDLLLGINIGSQMLIKNDKRADVVYGKDRNLLTFTEYLKYGKSLNKIIGIADVAYCNSSDEELLMMMKNMDMLYNIDAYAGWNTSSNTIGTVLATMSCYKATHDKKTRDEFLTYRYVEDYGYMAKTREVINQDIIGIEGSTRFDLGEHHDQLLHECHQVLENTMLKFSSEICSKMSCMTVKFPWNRTFEIKLSIQFEKE